jgi:hypothetical protein
LINLTLELGGACEISSAACRAVRRFNRGISTYLRHQTAGR